MDLIAIFSIIAIALFMFFRAIHKIQENCKYWDSRIRKAETQMTTRTKIIS